MSTNGRDLKHSDRIKQLKKLRVIKHLGNERQVYGLEHLNPKTAIAATAGTSDKWHKRVGVFRSNANYVRLFASD